MRTWLLVIGVVLAGSLAADMKVLAFAGSTREDSYNKKLVREAAGLAKQMGATVTVIDLKDFPMPFYDGDLEASQGLPPQAKRLRALMMDSDAIVIATPEYNGSVSAVLKNAIDWASRDEKGQFSGEAFAGKKFALMSASPGGGGGARALAHLQTIIENVGGQVLDQRVAIAKAYNVKNLTDNTQLKQEMQQLTQIK